MSHEEDTEQEVETQFSFSPGCLIRGACIRAIKDAAIEHGVRLDIDEDRGFFISHYVVTISGDKASVDGYIEAAKEFFSKIEHRR